MRKWFRGGCGLIVLVGVATLVRAQQPTRPPTGQHRQAAAALLEAMAMETAITETAVQAVVELLKLEPAWRAHRDLVVEFMDERIGWDALKEPVTLAYAETFTEAELRELTRFFESPTGRKLANRSLALAARIQTLVQERIEPDFMDLELRMKNRELEQLLEAAVFFDQPDPDAVAEDPAP